MFICSRRRQVCPSVRPLNGLSVPMSLPVDRLVCKRHRDRDAILRTQVSRDVTFPGCIFDQIDVAWTDRNLLASRNLDLSSTAERDHELAPRTRMPVVGVVGRPPAELYTGSLDHLCRVAVQFHF